MTRPPVSTAPSAMPQIRVAVMMSVGLGAMLSPTAHAQPPQRPTPSVADTSPFRALDLPAPNEYRTGSGRPGPRDWQPRADYRVAPTPSPARTELHRSE